MNKLMLGSALGFMMGVGLMMMPSGGSLRQDVRKGMSKAKKMMKQMEQQ